MLCALKSASLGFISPRGAVNSRAEPEERREEEASREGGVALGKDMLEKVCAGYCSPGRQLEIESTVQEGAVGGGLGWGKYLGNLHERRLHSAQARIRMLAKVR